MNDDKSSNQNDTKESDSSNSSESDVWTQSSEVDPADTPSAESLTKNKKDIEATEQEWERDVINRLAFAAVNEQRRSRRWNTFFKTLLFIYFAVLLFYIPNIDKPSITDGKHTALIDIEGVIAADAAASADNIVTALREAFKDKNTQGIILRINSPGGSPVQAGYVNDEIKRLRKKHENMKVYAVIVDVCASGGYYIAAAADEIYADKGSIVGSIGVLMDGFGFVDAMKKVGVERRLMTAGEHKGVLDPFSPVKKQERKHVQGILDGVHQQFINVVKEGRGDRLKVSDKLFSGLYWNGEESLKLGLVDGLGSSSYVAREIIGTEKIVNFTPRMNFIDRIADRIGMSMGRSVAQMFGLQLGGASLPR